MTKIYRDYDEEPEDVFLPLPEQLKCELYDLEMDAYREDTDFYDKLLPSNGTFLELGCGSGRITHRLGSTQRQMVGIDISLPMLQKAAHSNNPFCNYICMDMRQIAFDIQFDGILIPYNTLNLLTEKKEILWCLKACRQLLASKSYLFLQLHTPSAEFSAKEKKTFQFQIFDHPGGGRIIKEILRRYIPKTCQIEIEERYRIRPLGATLAREDLNTTYTISGYSADTWFSFFQESGLQATAIYEDFNGTTFDPSSSTSLIAILS